MVPSWAPGGPKAAGPTWAPAGLGPSWAQGWPKRGPAQTSGHWEICNLDIWKFGIPKIHYKLYQSAILPIDSIKVSRLFSVCVVWHQEIIFFVVVDFKSSRLQIQIKAAHLFNFACPCKTCLNCTRWGKHAYVLPIQTLATFLTKPMNSSCLPDERTNE